jgi:hypothetical protein
LLERRWPNRDVEEPPRRRTAQTVEDRFGVHQKRRDAPKRIEQAYQIFISDRTPNPEKQRRRKG